MAGKTLRQPNDIGVRIIPKIQRLDLREWVREYFSETSLRSCYPTRCHNPEDHEMNPHRTENLRSYINDVVCTELPACRGVILLPHHSIAIKVSFFVLIKCQ
jgi:hypothetical protein